MSLTRKWPFLSWTQPNQSRRGRHSINDCATSRKKPSLPFYVHTDVYSCLLTRSLFWQFLWISHVKVYFVPASFFNCVMICSICFIFDPFFEKKPVSSLYFCSICNSLFASLSLKYFCRLTLLSKNSWGLSESSSSTSCLQYYRTSMNWNLGSTSKSRAFRTKLFAAKFSINFKSFKLTKFERIRITHI